MATKERDTTKRTLSLSDDLFAWVVAAAKARGQTYSEFVAGALEAARTQEAEGVVQQQAAGAIEGAVSAGIRDGFDLLTQHLGAVFDLLTLEAMRARMTSEEHLAYLYDGSDLVCPHCGRPYVQGQTGPSFAAERSAIIAQKAREALAAGAVPRIRTW